MHTHSKIISRIAALSFAAALSGHAAASQEFPAAIQEAASMPCAPSCVLCHGVDPGTASTFTQKTIGAALFNAGAMEAHNTDRLKAAYAKYSADPANAASVTALKAGIDPQTGSKLCELTYGCGAHIAKDAPRDDWSGLLFVAGAVGFGALLRRAKRR